MRRILLVEDSPMQTRAIESYFEMSDYYVACAAQLAEAIERVRHEEFDAILLDLALPDAHGRETFRRLHESAPAVPVVILTSNDDEELAVQLMRDGAQDYLVKGEVTASWVRRALRYAIERSLAAGRRFAPQVRIAEPRRSLSVESAGEVTIVRVQEAKLADSDVVDQMSQELLRLAGDEQRKKFLLDCKMVEYLSNSALGQLMVWDQKIRKKGGAMRIFGLRSEVQDQIKVRRLLAQFNICLDEAAALAGI